MNSDFPIRGTEDCRVSRDQLERFQREHGMPLEQAPETEPSVGPVAADHPAANWTAKPEFTMKEVAQIVKVAPRTVNKWVDSGRLKGYRTANGKVRLVPREQLIRFLKEHNMPLGELEDAQPY